MRQAAWEGRSGEPLEKYRTILRITELPTVSSYERNGCAWISVDGAS